DRLVVERLADEADDHAAIERVHSWPISVEDADDAGVGLALAVVGHGAGFAEALGLVVHAAQADRVDVAPIILALRVDGGVAVTFAGAGHQKTRALVARRFQQVPRSL